MFPKLNFLNTFNCIWLIQPTFQHIYPIYINTFYCTFQTTERFYTQQNANKLKWYLKHSRAEVIFWNCWNVLVNSMPRRCCQHWILMLNLKSKSVNISNIQIDKLKSGTETKMKGRDKGKYTEHHSHHCDVRSMFLS